MSDVDARSDAPSKATALDTPGPESFQAPAIRRWITLSYWTIILLCIPYWWHSTTIERHALPLDRIATWQNSGPCPIVLPVHVSISSAGSSSALRVDNVLDRLNQISRNAERCLIFKTTSQSYGSAYQLRLEEFKDGSFRLESNRSATLGYKDKKDIVMELANLFMPSPVSGSGHHSPCSQTSKTIRYAEKYKLVFSLFNEDISKGGITQWNISAALDHHIYPLLRTLKGLHEYSVETQIQYYAPLVVERKLTEQGAVIADDQLKVFVNSAEWNLASSVSSEPVLHFILYVPASDKRPLLIEHADGTVVPLTFFSIPQWGGVIVHDMQTSATEDALPPANLAYEDMHAAFARFASLLRVSHGVPDLERFGGSNSEQASWAVQALMRERTVQNVRDAIQKLGAIARQANEIQNMRIPKAVQEDVNAALDALASVESEDVLDAMRQSAKAESLATRASFNHEMLAMLYFPDEHKWAVYTPLFGPIAVPLMVALLREIKEYKKRRREKLKKD